MNQFDKVPIKKPAANVFTLDHDVKSSYNFDKLYPFMCQPVYPGDTFNCRAEVFMRTMPLLSPVMHNVDLRMYFFFVPNRLIFNEDKKHDWKIFITGGEDGMQEAVLPYFTYRDIIEHYPDFAAHGSLLDHMGFPSFDKDVLNASPQLSAAADEKVCSLPFRAYQLVYNEYFRNQNLQNEIEFDYGQGKEDGPNIGKIFQFRRKCWEKDYFTSCLPWAQRGEAMKLPIDINSDASALVSAPVVVDRVTNPTNPAFVGTFGVEAESGTMFANVPAGTGIPTANLTGTATIDSSQISFTGLSIGTISDFRACLRLQQWMENNARCGSRYIEQLLSHFGVVSSDARLQRPELLGGGVIPLIFTDIEQQSFGDQSTPDNVLGNLGGKGTLYGKSNGFKKYFEEHGILLGILTILPRTSYSQGIPRAWTAFDKTDWYFPEFANLGEQAVLKKEVFYNPLNNMPTEPNAVFGYQGRFTELRYIPSSVHGEMRDTLKYWHFGRIFPAEPSLNAEFVEADTRADVFAQTEIVDEGFDPFVAQIHLDISAVRPMPKFAVPTL